MIERSLLRLAGGSVRPPPRGSRIAIEVFFSDPYVLGSSVLSKMCVHHLSLRNTAANSSVETLKYRISREASERKAQSGNQHALRGVRGDQQLYSMAENMLNQSEADYDYGALGKGTKAVPKRLPTLSLNAAK